MSGEASTPKDLNKCTVNELKEELSARGLSTSGVKKDLIERLLEDYKCEQAEEVQKEEHFEEEHEERHERYEDCEHKERDPSQEEGEEEHIEGHEVNGEDPERENRDMTSDDELDEVLGDAREAFEEGMRGEEFEDEEQYVTLDKYDDKEDVPPESHEAVKDEDEGKKEKATSDGEKSPSKEKKETKEEEKEEKLPMPPDQVHKWIFKQSSVAKKYSSLYVSELTPKDILCPTMVEWANRAVYFCVNQARDGKGTAVLNFASDKEAKEAKEALNVNFGEAVKVAYPSISIEDEIRSGLTYRFDTSHPLGQRVLTIEDFPQKTTEDQLNSIFPEAILAFRPDISTHVQNWQSEDYIIPENIEKIYFVEFAHPKVASKAVADDKEYELEGKKLRVRLLSDFEDTYKKKYVKEMNDAREKKWEELEKKKKEVASESYNFNDQDRLQLYRDLEDTVNKRAKLTRNPHITWEEKMLKKQKLTAKVFDIVRKIDSDADRRIKEGQKFPEHSRIMTKHTKNEFMKLAPHQRGTYEGGKDGAGGDWKPRGRGMHRSSLTKSSYDSYRGRGRGRGSIRGRGRGSSSYDYRRESSDRSGYSKDSYYQDTKRRRTDDYDHGRSRKEDPGVVTNALKSLTEVLSTKMDEMSRIAGGMKARERELQDAVHSVKRRGASSYTPAPKRRYEGDSYSSQSYKGSSGGRYYSSSDASHSRYSTGDSYSSSHRYQGSDSYGHSGGGSSYYSSGSRAKSSYSGGGSSDKYSSHTGYHSSSSRRGSRGGYSKY